MFILYLILDVIGHVNKFFSNDDKDKKVVADKKRLTMEIQDIEYVFFIYLFFCLHFIYKKKLRSFINCVFIFY